MFWLALSTLRDYCLPMKREAVYCLFLSTLPIEEIGLMAVKYRLYFFMISQGSKVYNKAGGLYVGGEIFIGT